MNLGNINWGSVPDWLAALGTIGAVWYAVTSGTSARHDMVEPVLVGTISGKSSENASYVSVWLINVGQGPAIDCRLDIKANGAEFQRFSTGKTVVHPYSGTTLPGAPRHNGVMALDHDPWELRSQFSCTGPLPKCGEIILEYRGRFGKWYKKRVPFCVTEESIDLKWPS